MLDVPFRSARQLAAGVRKKEIGCLELLDLYLARVERYDGAINAVVVRDFDRARRRARAADRALAKGEVWGPLHGVPITVKESYDVAGLPTTWGLPSLRDHVATKNALAVDRLLGAGAVLFGKTNVPLYLADWQSFNAIYGTTNNPWDVARAPGGSSGGSAAALAAGLTGLEAGSDIGSSIRNPAHFCGVFGHKPTWGIVPRHGQSLPGQVAAVDIDVVGPLARSADDLALALSVMAGPDPIEAAGWQLHLRPARQKRLRDFKVAVMLEAPESAVDAEVQDRLQGLADFLGRQKVKVDDRARPAIDTDEAFRVYVRLLRAATSSRQSDAEFDMNAAVARAPAPLGERQLLRALDAGRRACPIATGWPPTRRGIACDWHGPTSSRGTTSSSAPWRASPPSPTTRRASGTSAWCCQWLERARPNLASGSGPVPRLMVLRRRSSGRPGAVRQSPRAVPRP